MTAISAKDGYFARGDALSPASQGPDEPVATSTQIMTATRFSEMQASEAEIRRFASVAGQHGGHDIAREGRVFETAKVAAGAAGAFTLSPSLAGYDVAAKSLSGHCPKRAADGSVNAAPAGSFVLNTDTLANFTDVPYADVAATEYNIGIAVATVPSRAEQNSRTGKFELTGETAVVGVVSTPTLIAYDSGAGDITLTLSNDKLNGGGSSLAGRNALAWFLNSEGYAEGETETAIQFGPLVWNGSENELILPGAFGQTLTSIDLTAAQYRVCLLGPAVWSGAKDLLTDGVAWIAHGDNDTAWDMDGQNGFPSTFGMLANFVRMSDPSASGADLVSLPKISVRPNDNEAGSEPQIQVWKDAAATSLAFEVDKDGNVSFDGALSGASGTTFPVGVDDAVVGRTSVFEMFHTSSVGVGVAGKGPRALLTVETTVEGERQPVGALSAIADSNVSGSLNGGVFLSAYGGGAELPTIGVNANGEGFASGIASSVIDRIGYGGDWGAVADGPVGAAFSGMGASINQNALASFNSVGALTPGDRACAFKFLGRRLTGALVVQGQIEGYHDGSTDDDLSNIAIKINDGSALTAGLIAEFFDDYTNPVFDEVGCRVDQIRGITHEDVRISTNPGAGAPGVTVLRVGQVFAHGMAQAATNDYTSRLSWHFETSDPFEDTVAHIGVGATTDGYDMRFVGFTPGIERIAMNIHYSVTNADNRVEITNNGTSILPIGFSTLNQSPLQIVHKEQSGAYSGIDICSALADAGTDGSRSSAINFLGLHTTGPTETRLGGIRCHFDGVLGSLTFPSKMMLWVNGGGAADSIEHGIEIYSDGFVRSANTAAWAKVNFAGGPGTYIKSRGFNESVAITNPGVGRYRLQLAVTPIGASIDDAVFVNAAFADFYHGRGFWVTLSPPVIEVRTWYSPGGGVASILADADFFVAAYSSANLTPAP